MNEHDKDNLNFILNSSEEVLRDWFDKITEDDQQYAFEILNEYSRELATRRNLLQDDNVVVTDVNTYLKKFML